MNILFWNLIWTRMSSRVCKFRYNMLFTFLMDRGRAPNGIGHLMILFSDISQRWKGTVS